MSKKKSTKFSKDSKNEFKRDNPQTLDSTSISMLHKIIPIVLVFLSFVISSQLVAFRLNFNPSFVGYPWFILSNKYPVYYPFLILIMLVKALVSLEFDGIVSTHVYSSTFVLVIGSFTAVIIYFVLAWARSNVKNDQNIHGTSRWANEKDIEAVGLFEESGIVIGQHNNAKVNYAVTGGAVKLQLEKPAKILRHSGETSTIMFAPSRSGKGVSSVIPTCIDWPQSLITIDPKGENFNITSGYRRLFSHILRVSPCSEDTLKFNILDEITEKGAFRQASMIADILTSPPDGKVDGSSKHWVDTAKDLLTGAILHCKCSDYKDKSLYGVLSFLSQSSKKDSEDDKGKGVLEAMMNSHHCNEQIHSIVCNVAQRNMTRPDDERGSVFSTAVTALQVFEDPLVRNCSSSSDFCLNDFKVSENPISLYITIPFSDLDRLSSYVRIIITFILREFSSDETQFGEIKLKNRILFLIDEFPTLGTFQTLEVMMGILAGYGIVFYLICQSPAQIYKLYGQDTVIFDHCKYMMTYAMSDTKGAEMFSKMTGVKSVTYGQQSSSGNRFDAGMNNLSNSIQTQQVNLLNADEFQKLPANQLVIFPQGSPPILAKKNVYYSDPRYKDKTNPKLYPPPKSRVELLKECANTTKPDLTKRQWFDIPEEAYMQQEDFIFTPVFTSTVPDDEDLSKMQEELALL